MNTGIDKRSSMLRTRQRKNSSTLAKLPHNGPATTGTGRISGSSQACSGVPITPVTSEAMDAQTGGKADVEIENITSTMSSLKFVPPSIRFGRGGKRGGFSRT